MLAAYTVRVYGRVQRVGFRRYILDNAQDLGLQGYVKNKPDGSVLIFVQGDNVTVDRFLQLISNPPYPIRVDRVLKESASIEPDMRYFVVKYDDLASELQEGFGSMESIFMNYWLEFRDFATRTDNNFKKVIELQSLTLEEIREVKVDVKEMKTDIKEMKADIKEVKADIKEMKDDIKEMKTDIKGIKDDTKEIKDTQNTLLDVQNTMLVEIRELRKDSRILLDERLKKIEEDIARIKARLGLT